MGFPEGLLRNAGGCNVGKSEHLGSSCALSLKMCLKMSLKMFAFTAACSGITWMTKDGLRKPNYWGSLTQAATLRVGNYEGDNVLPCGVYMS
jgi:hypothetical protein